MKPGPFDVVICAEDTRLVRNQDDDVLSVLIRQCKVRVLYAQSGQEVKLTTSTDRFLTKVTSYVAESYAEFISGPNSGYARPPPGLICFQK